MARFHPGPFNDRGHAGRAAAGRGDRPFHDARVHVERPALLGLRRRHDRLGAGRLGRTGIFAQLQVPPPKRDIDGQLPRPELHRAGGRRAERPGARTAASGAGMAVTAQNAWPSLAFDVGSANAALSRFIGAGFYYKTFIKPQRLVAGVRARPAAFCRRRTGLGKLTPGRLRQALCPPGRPRGRRGPAGMSAALAAAEAGASVMLVEEEYELGGHLRYGRAGELAVLAELRRAVAATSRDRGPLELGRHRSLRRQLGRRTSAGAAQRHRAPGQGAGQGAGGRPRAHRAALRLRGQRPPRGDALHGGATAGQPVRRPARTASGGLHRQRRRRRRRRGSR